MRVLLDECVPRRLQRYIIHHEAQTVPQAGFAGKKNGELLILAEHAGFDVLLTVDKKHVSAAEHGGPKNCLIDRLRSIKRD